jgi:hypothetical protein
MGIVVEDGTGLDTANAFASVAEVAAYLNDRGATAFATLATPTKEAAIISASEMISSAYGWAGRRLDLDQRLAWPRIEGGDGRYVPSGVPTQVKDAVARVAYAVSRGADLYATVEAGDAVTRVKAGSVEVQFSEAALQIAAAGRPAMPWLTDMLAGLITVAPDAPGNNMSFSFMHVARV